MTEKMKAFPTNQLAVSDMGQVRAINPLQDGMDLRDYFAAKALMSMLAPVQDITENTPNIATTWAYKFADAMMKAREL